MRLTGDIGQRVGGRWEEERGEVKEKGDGRKPGGTSERVKHQGLRREESLRRGYRAGGPGLPVGVGTKVCPVVQLALGRTLVHQGGRTQRGGNTGYVERRQGRGTEGEQRE